MQEIGKIKQNKNEDNEDEVENEEDEIKVKQKLIHKQKVSRRWKVVLLNVCIMSFLSTYFVASYFVSDNLYSQVPYIMDALHTVYFKDVCLENAMTYLRINHISNQSFILYENG